MKLNFSIADDRHLEKCIYNLRHTCASQLVQNGLSLYETAQMLGHVDVKTTQRYAHLENREIGQRARDIIKKLRG